MKQQFTKYRLVPIKTPFRKVNYTTHRLNNAPRPFQLSNSNTTVVFPRMENPNPHHCICQPWRRLRHVSQPHQVTQKSC